MSFACRVLALVAAAAVLLGACGDEGNAGTGPSGGGGAGAMAAGGMAGAGGAGGDPPDVVACGEPAVSLDIPCPEACTGGCSDGQCLIDCSAEQACNSIVECPTGMDCQVTCSGQGSCRYQIICNDYYQCSIGCTGVASCTGAEIQCGAIGKCHVTCAVADACNNADVQCGDGECASLCFGVGLPDISCNDSCDCNTTCGE